MNTKQEITRQKLMEELAVIAFADTTEYLSVKDGVLTVADIPKGAALGAIQSVEKTSGGIRVRFYDKLKALELLGKATGLFEGLAQEESGNLLEAIVGATEQEVDMDDLQEFQ